MQIDDLTQDELRKIQVASNGTLTRVILCEVEIVGTVAKMKTLLVEPLTVEITTNA